MNLKTMTKMMIDLIMCICLFILMGFMITDQEIHEWTGTIMIVLFVLHNLLNISWYKVIFKGKYSLTRTIKTIINFALLICFLLLGVSGMMMSRYVTPQLSFIDALSFARILHMASAYWGFLLMSLHLGMHTQMIFALIRNHLGIAKSKKNFRILSLIILFSISIYGFYAFLKHDLISYMLIRTEFVFFDYSQSSILFFVDYISIMIFFIVIINCILKLAQSKKVSVTKLKEKL